MGQPLRIGPVPLVPDVEFVARLGLGLGAGRFKARLDDGSTSSLLVFPAEREERGYAIAWARRFEVIEHPGVPEVRRIEET